MTTDACSVPTSSFDEQRRVAAINEANRAALRSDPTAWLLAAFMTARDYLRVADADSARWVAEYVVDLAWPIVVEGDAPATRV